VNEQQTEDMKDRTTVLVAFFLIFRSPQLVVQTTVYTMFDLSILMQLMCILHTLYFLLASYAAMAFVRFWRISQDFAHFGGNNC